MYIYTQILEVKSTEDSIELPGMNIPEGYNLVDVEIVVAETDGLDQLLAVGCNFTSHLLGAVYDFGPGTPYVNKLTAVDMPILTSSRTVYFQNATGRTTFTADSILFIKVIAHN